MLQKVKALSEIAKNRAHPHHHHQNAAIDTDLDLQDIFHLTEVVIEHLEVIDIIQIVQTRPIEDEIGKLLNLFANINFKL